MGTKSVADEGGVQVSRHLATLHHWHNSDHVNRGLGERGPLGKHRKHVEGLLADPGVLPMIMSWNGGFRATENSCTSRCVSPDRIVCGCTAEEFTVGF